MFEFLIDNIFDMFGGHVFQQTESAYLWVPTVFFFSKTYPYSRMRLNTKGLSRKTEGSLILKNYHRYS